MPSSQRGPGSGTPVAFRIGAVSRELTRAAVAAVQAPSVLNTQPWHWRIAGDAALLYADRRRRLAALDPSGRMLVVSCGAALHHACVTLAAEGAGFTVEPFPEGEGDLLAVIRYRGPAAPSVRAQRLHSAIPVRSSDRRPFAARPVPEPALERMRRAAQRVGAHLQLTWSRDLTDIATAAGQATAAMLSDPACRSELAAWVRRPGEGDDGVPLDTVAPPGARPVPLRDFTGTGGGPSITSEVDVGDREARYGVVVTDGDGPNDWLTAGVALSAVMLTATAEHLATSAMSDLVEREVSRRTLRHMLGGVGYPAIGLRIGVPAAGPAPPRAPRRPAIEIVEVVADPVPADGSPSGGAAADA
ncbi:Acg family FMN-binding oxidoreductase [Dactylosporangium sp. CA-233914]|uniref:Acg family FMN-binding oxidoreductase n=1 Tax=Dactylosporangium sp. CA-233914 TaxID=3239934 RepID=UPI003D8A4B2C